MANGLDFERQVHALLKNMGFEAEITKASGDGGIDIIAHSKEHITGGKYVIQCKDWSKPVGEPPVRDLYGVVTAENANKGILITTSTFTAPALKFAEGKPLELIDGAKFNQLLTKYSVAGSHDGAMSNVEDDRIKELTEQLNKNLKNILVLKELADIYLLKGDYNKAVELYKTLVPLEPSVETKRLTRAYYGGLNNYGVALAKLKRYDDALKVFKEYYIWDFSFLPLSNEASLTHYLGLYDIATSIYQRIKRGLDESEIYDGFIETAYLKMQMDYPTLWVESDDGNDEMKYIPLETALQKAYEEANQILYQPFLNSYLSIYDEFVEILTKLLSDIETDAILENHADAEKIGQLINRCSKVIPEYGHLIDIATNSSLQESCKQMVIPQLETVKLICDGMSKFVDCASSIKAKYETWADAKNILSACANDILLKEVQRSREETLMRKFDEEYKQSKSKWEDIINKEKAEWREKLRRTLY